MLLNPLAEAILKPDGGRPEGEANKLKKARIPQTDEGYWWAAVLADPESKACI